MGLPVTWKISLFVKKSRTLVIVMWGLLAELEVLADGWLFFAFVFFISLRLKRSSTLWCAFLFADVWKT